MERSAGDQEQLDARLVLPPGLCAQGCGTSPEQLFTAGNSACLLGAHST